MPLSVPLLKEAHCTHTGDWKAESHTFDDLHNQFTTLIKTREVLGVGRESVGEIEGVLS